MAHSLFSPSAFWYYLSFTSSSSVANFFLFSDIREICGQKLLFLTVTFRPLKYYQTAPKTHKSTEKHKKPYHFSPDFRDYFVVLQYHQLVTPQYAVSAHHPSH